ncbi:MAG: phosphotransferase family protein [Tepidiformaceae bacterium]
MKSELSAYLAKQLPSDDGVAISNLARIPGGASRETWLFDASWTESGAPQTAALVLRKDPPASLVESDRAVEYAFYSAFHGTEVPVPAMRWLESDSRDLGAPFFIMDRITVGETNVRNLSEPPYATSRPMIGRRMFEVLGAIHRFDWSSSEIAPVVAAPTCESAWGEQVGYWEEMVARNEISPQPIVRAAIRWLRRNPPPPAQRVSVIHGDYRVGNFLYSAEGIHGVLDWEMAHLGDPLEDFAWACHELWDRSLISKEQSIEVYEQASGLKVEADALHWWDVFTGVKAQGIWLTGAKSFDDGRSPELMLAYAAYMLTNATDEALLRSLGRGA